MTIAIPQWWSLTRAKHIPWRCWRCKRRRMPWSVLCYWCLRHELEEPARLEAYWRRFRKQLESESRRAGTVQPRRERTGAAAQGTAQPGPRTRQPMERHQAPHGGA